MIKQSSTSKNQITALQQSKKILEGIEHFVFFGTLLGLTREGRPISGDDDIDYYVKKSEQDLLLSRLSSMGIQIDRSVPWNKSRDFFQIFLQTDSTETAVDFYFYENDANRDYIWDRWNFSGTPDKQSTWMKTPSPFIFPLQIETFDSVTTFVPNKKKLTCEWLYGSSWQTPKKKKLQYQIKVIAGKPMMFELDIQSEHKKFHLVP